MAAPPSRRSGRPERRKGSSPLPYLRFTRDRGGYETTALLHTHGRSGKGQPRVLYYFRTPPNVRVGRSPIDEDAIRLLEESNPDVEFDWTRILKQTPPPPAPEPKRERRGDRRREGRGQQGGVERRAKEQPPAPRPPVPREREEPRPPMSALDGEPAEPAELVEPMLAPSEDADVQAAAEQIAAGDLDEGIEPLAPISADDTVVEAGPEPPVEGVRSPTLERLGAEGLARLRARYAEVLARIAERPLDEAAREQLKLQAERLNPDAWVTAAEVNDGLEQYETVYESLRAVVGAGHRRRRRRR